MKHILIFIIAVCVTTSLAGCGLKQKKFNSQNIDNYASIKDVDPSFIQSSLNQNKDVKFEFDYPQNWEVVYRIGGTGQYSITVQPKEQIRDEASILIDYIDTSKDGSIYENELKRARELYMDINESEEKPDDKTQVNKIIGVVVGGIVKGEQGTAIIKYNDKLYKVTTFFNAENEKNMEIFNQIVSSFKIIE